jgi:hypothetical protein
MQSSCCSASGIFHCKAGAVASDQGHNQDARNIYTAHPVRLQAMGWMASVVGIAGAIELDGAFMAGA